MESNVSLTKQKLLQQHWVNGAAAKPFVDQLDWQGLHVLELGAGSGELTRLLAASGARLVEAIELDEELPPVDDGKVVWRNADIRQLKPVEVARFDVLAAFAPYDLLDLVFDLALVVDKAFLMVPQRRLQQVQDLGYLCLGYLPGSAFEPPASGQHYLVSKGWPSRLLRGEERR